MTFSELLEKFSKAPSKYKAAGLLGVVIFIGVMFYILFYQSISEEIDGLDGQIKNVQLEITKYEEQKQKYMAFRAEVNKLLEEQKDLLKVLPAEKKIYDFLQDLHAQGELIGLTILNLEQGQEVPENFYAKIPVKMEVSGTYLQIAKYFYSIGKLKRIVNIQDLKLTSPKFTDSGVVLKASFLASTFRFLAPQQPQPAAGVKGG